MIGRVLAVAYVVAVTALAAHGFARDSTEEILLAGALALPFSVPAGIGFYAAYGLLALVPGANPSENSATVSCTANHVCESSSTGDAASWFLFATDVIGVVALAVAAIANVLLVRFVLSRLRRAPST